MLILGQQLIYSMAENKDLNRVKVILAEKKKSNLWLSKQLGCAPTTVSKWCTNSSQPPLEMLMKMSKVLDVELNELVRFDELDETPPCSLSQEQMRETD